MRKKVGAIAVAVVITLVLGACVGDDAGASQGTTKLANPTTGPAVTGPAVTAEETGPTETAYPPARAPAPDVVRQRTCSEGAGSRLELTDIGRPRMRFEVRRSPVGHSWRITLRANRPGGSFTLIQRTKVAGDSGDLAVQVGQWGDIRLVEVEAVDTQTGQVCRVNVEIE
jgi:hypothetical protein